MGNENVSVDPDEAIRRRLVNLRADDACSAEGVVCFLVLLSNVYCSNCCTAHLTTLSMLEVQSIHYMTAMSHNLMMQHQRG